MAFAYVVVAQYELLVHIRGSEHCRAGVHVVHHDGDAVVFNHARLLGELEPKHFELKEHKNNAHTLLLALSYLRSQPGRPRARHGELTPRWPRVRELPLPLLLGLEERR